MHLEVVTILVLIWLILKDQNLPYLPILFLKILLLTLTGIWKEKRDGWEVDEFEVFLVENPIKKNRYEDIKTPLVHMAKDQLIVYDF